MKTRRIIGSILLLSFAFSMAFGAQARPVGKIRNVRQPVEARPGMKSNWTRVRERSPIEIGQYIRSGPKGKALLKFTNSTSVVLNSNSQVFIEGDNTPAKPLGLLVFGALSQVFVRSRGPMKIRGSAAVAAPEGTEYMVSLPDENTMVVTVAEGVVRFYNAQGEVLIRPNQQSTAKIGGAPTDPVAVDASGLMQWAFDVAGLPVEFEMPAPNNGAADINALQARVTANPDDGAAQAALGEALRRTDDANGAVAAYQRAVQLTPSDNTRVGLALALLSRNDVNEARTALGAAPESAIALAALGLVQLRSNDAKAAEQSLNEAARRDPQLAQAPALLALTHLTQNNVAAAVTAGRRAVQLAPNSSQAQSALALALFYDGKPWEASRAAAQAVITNPESPMALLVQGQALLAQRHTDVARSALLQAESLAPRLPLIHINLGAAYNRLDMPQRAEKAYRRALEIAPDSASARAGLGGVLLATGRKLESLSELRRALELEPNNTLARANLASYYIETGDFPAAERELGDISDEPAAGVAYVRLSEAKLFQQQLLAAQEFALKAVKLLPDSALAHYQLGRVYREQDRTIQAEQEFRQAVILDREFAKARFALGLAREASATGRDFLRPLNGLSSNDSGPRQGINIQNLQSPGYQERIQAAIQDPSVVRTASRSFGDNQFEGLLGGRGNSVFNFSHLQEINNRRGSFGVGISRDSTNGVRANADATQERAGFVVGSKQANTPSGYFALGQWEHRRLGTDYGPAPVPFRSAQRGEATIPLVIVGYNAQKTENRRTRYLLQFDRPTSELTDDGGFINTKSHSYHGEVRHDFRWGTKHWLSAGAAVGQRRFEGDTLFQGFPPIPDFRLLNRVLLRQEQIYLRNDFAASRQLTISGEIKAERVQRRTTIEVVSPPELPGEPPGKRSVVIGVPKLVLDYTPTRTDIVRMRLQGVAGDIEDFQYLNPTDQFPLLPIEATRTGLFVRGSNFDAEWTHTFRNASLLRFGAFLRRFDKIASIGGEPLADARHRGLLARYEGPLTRSTTFFLGANMNDAKASIDTGGVLPPRSRISFIPRYSAEMGLQFLNERGWLVQPSIAYLSSRLQSSTGALDGPRATLGGAAYANLRVGKRSGLRSFMFVEVTNIFDKSFIAASGNSGGELRPGRQFFVGMERRF